MITAMATTMTAGAIRSRRYARREPPHGSEGKQQQDADGDNDPMRPDGGVHHRGVIAQHDDGHEGEHADGGVPADEKLGAAQRRLGARMSLVFFRSGQALAGTVVPSGTSSSSTRPGHCSPGPGALFWSARRSD
jgi:hypothetical protein